jgi:hypothetical protein
MLGYSQTARREGSFLTAKASVMRIYDPKYCNKLTHFSTFYEEKAGLY